MGDACSRCLGKGTVWDRRIPGLDKNRPCPACKGVGYRVAPR